MSKKITIIIEDDGTAQGIGYPNFQYPQYNDPCRYCGNNPAINPHASGICNCALPALANPMY